MDSSSFINLALDCSALQFGEFTLKSGRISPYFFNAGKFDTGASLHQVGCYYAKTLADSGLSFDMLFGPAYKGIPLATSVAIALAKEHDQSVGVAFNRKEAKTHGEAGLLIGAPLKGRVVIVDDVITAGTAIRESIEMITHAGAEPAAVIVALDREEQGQNGKSAIQEVEETYKLPVYTIAKLTNLLTFVKENAEFTSYLSQLTAYRQAYGIK
jgi:orotate phosphoribosyltransferase